MTTDKAMEILGVSRATISRLVKTGTLEPLGGVRKSLRRQPPYEFLLSDVERVRDTPVEPSKRALKRVGE